MWGSSANALVNEADDPNITTNHALTVSGLAPNTTYYFQATSADSTGQAHSSQILSVTTLPQWTISGISAQASRTGATIQWTTAAYPTSGYVNWGLSSSGLTNQSAMAAVGNGHSIGLSGLSPATTYYYQVVASDGLGQSQSSPIQSFTTAADWGISGFAGLATRNSVTLSWQTSDQVTAGSILWGTSSALGNAAPEGSIASTNHQMVVSGLAPDTDYYFQVLATDPTGVSKTSNLILVHTALDWTIGGFAGTSTQTSVTVTWATNGYATSGSVAWGSDATLGHSVVDSVNGTSHSVTISGLNPDTTYYFQAASIDADGISKSSSVAAIRTQPVPLPVWKISNFAGTSTTSSVTLSWQTAQYATSGNVLYGTDLASLSSQQADTVTGTSHSLTISGLRSGTSYYFQVVASDDRGQTQSSDVIQVNTMSSVVTPPANWTIVGFDGTTTATQANLIWQTPGANTTATVSVGLSADNLTLMTLTVTTAAQTQQLAVPGLSPNTKYYFQVTATDTSGITHQSVVIQKTTKAQ
jgi:phosphodiesterase/alkaline phosphatase D-like protein